MPRVKLLVGPFFLQHFGAAMIEVLLVKLRSLLGEKERYRIV